MFLQKYARIIEYLNKYIISEKNIKFRKNISNINEKILKITKLSIYKINNNINSQNYLFNKKYLKILIIMIYMKILPIQYFILIINIFLESLINKNIEITNNSFLLSNSALYFINDLFEALINIPRKYINDEIHIKLINQLISILDKHLFSSPFQFELHKLQIWLKLLGNKIIRLDREHPLSYDKLIAFLVKIYKYNFHNLYYYQDIYEKSAISFDYYINSLDFLTAIFKEEEKLRNSSNFKIKEGFYINNNKPLTLDKIKFKLKEYSLIFSFKLTKISNKNDNTLLFNLVNQEKDKIVLYFVINKNNHILKIIDSKYVEWNTGIVIEMNKDYLICFSQEQKTFGKAGAIFSINNINLKNKEKLCNTYTNKTLCFPEFEHIMELELGKNNFEGIFGEVILINNIIKSENINHLYNLKGNYADVISSINFKNDLSFSNKKYTNEKDDIKYFSNFKYKCILKILTYQISSLLNNLSSITINPYGQLKYLSKNQNNNNNEQIIRLYSINYAIINFPNQHGFDYLIFILHKIISSSENDELLNFYLYKTLYFVLEYIKFESNYIFHIKNNNKVKTEVKYTIFAFSLLLLLNTKKRKLQLDEKIRDLLIEYNKIYREKKALSLLKMNFSILLDENIFKRGKIDIYNKIMDELKFHLDNSENESSLLYNEILYKILLMDDILESKDIKHKKYMEILSYFVIENKKNELKDEKKSKIKDIKIMVNNFMEYFLELNSPKKIYHYLKLIYFNINSFRIYFEENNEYLKYLLTNSNKIINDKNNFKYCQYIQILCFLINEIIFQNELFSYVPYGFMQNPNYKFIKCVFINNFNIDNRIKLSFIKSTLQYKNEMDSLRYFLPKKNSCILSLFDLKNFVQKLNSLINYYFFLYKQNITTKDKNQEILLIKGIKLIFNFFEEIIKNEELKLSNPTSNIKSEEIILNKGNIINILNKGAPKNPNPNEEDPNYQFLNELFSSSGIKLIFIIYLNLYRENELKDLNKTFEQYINFSISKIYNPFYLYLLLPNIILSNNISKHFNFKNGLLDIIINNIIPTNNNIGKGNINNTLILNSIIVLIRMYHLILDQLSIQPKLEKSIFLYLKYLSENNFLYSKNIFNINLIDEDVTKKDQNNSKNADNKKEKEDSNIEEENKWNKFLPEIILEIIFHFLEKMEKNENYEYISFLYDYLQLKENNSIFYKIDEYFFLETNIKNQINSKNYLIDFLNSSKISTNYCESSNLNNIVYSIYFLIYFIYKKKSNSSLIKKEKDKMDKKETKLEELTNKALEVLFKDCINIFKNYSKKIKRNKIKDSNDKIFKIYDTIFEHFSSKYKDNKFIFSDGNCIFSYFIELLKNTKKKKTVKFSIFSTRKESNSNDDFSLFFSRSKNRRETFMPSKIFETELNVKNENNNNRFRRKRVFSVIIKSFKIKDKFIKKMNEFNEKKKNDKIVENKICLDKDSENINKSSIEDENLNNVNILYGNTSSTSKLELKEIKKDVEISELNYTKDKTYTDNNSSIENDSDSSSNDNININPNNNINEEKNKNLNNKIIDEKTQQKNKKQFYLKKNPSSSKNLHLKMILHDKEYNNEDNYITNTINEEEIVNENETVYEHEFLSEKIKELNIPNIYYRKLIPNNNYKWIRIVFNPKSVIFKIFGFVFKKYLFYNRSFSKLKNTFKIRYKNIELEKSIPEEENYYLNYPSKLKNFTCEEYYKPFLKPMSNFFEDEYFEKSHSYLKKEIILNDIDEGEKFRKINYEKLSLSIKDKKKSEKNKLKNKITCEYISNKGSIFGNIYLDSYLMIFKDKINKDERSSITISEKRKLLFLFSSEETDRLKDKNKYIVMYYSEIKEIILRKFVFNEIAYEIFMKDGRVYFFNFFTSKNRKDFHDSFVSSINSLNLSIKNEELEKTGAGIAIFYMYDNNYANISFINEPKLEFEKKQLALKYSKKEITNFNYLLLVNKFSSRTYNDINQYLIFPLLYLNVEKTKLRDLSKAICLNKEDEYEEFINRYKNNYETLGYHFNNHYASMAYVLFYLIRLIPFTFSQIKFQSGHFDAASRMFTSLENLLYIYNESDENRELCPEFFYSYESFLNLNYNNFGFLNHKQIHHFNNNQNCSIVEFIIDLRKILEKQEISPWINNIFGCNQLNNDINSLNKFPNYSYEQYNNFSKEKEEIYAQIGEEELDPEEKKAINKKINDLRRKIQILTLGLTPSQLFKYPHPIKDKKQSLNNIPKLEVNNNKNKIINLFGRKKANIYNINSKLIDFISKNYLKDLLFIFDNDDNDHSKIIYLYKNELILFDFIIEIEKKIKLQNDLKIITIKPYKNIFIELYDSVYILCRLINRTFLLFSETQQVFIKWPCIITAMALYSHDEIQTNIKIHINKIIIGDEEGNLSLIKIETEYNEKKKEFKISSLSKIFKRYKAFYSYINAIIYNKRLNIIITSSNEGFISINNGFSFEIINIIEINNRPNILDLQLTKYDLLYIHYYKNNDINKDNNEKYGLYCYTLNGIKVSNLNTNKEYINFFMNDYGLTTISRDGSINQYNYSSLKEIEDSFDKEEIKDISNKGHILFSFYFLKFSNILFIFEKNCKVIGINNEI